MQKRGVVQKSFIVAVILVLGAVVFASQLTPSDSTTGQLVTKSNFGPNDVSSPIAEDCSSCPSFYNGESVLGEPTNCYLKQDCPTGVRACSAYKCTYDCYTLGVKTYPNSPYKDREYLLNPRYVGPRSQTCIKAQSPLL